MPKRLLPYCLVIALTMALTTIFQPLAHIPALAQSGGCQTFKETGKTVCGRFLEYWQKSGGLAQQGLPLSNEFTEKSDLNGQTYTVQYFERAVFEKHPENTAPYDVLLSQLGTFRYKAKYPAGAPGQAANPTAPPQATQRPQPTPPVSKALTSENIVNIVRAAGLPIAEVTIYTAETDPNHLLGRPNQYVAKASWHDTRLPTPSDLQSIEVSDGGGIEVWPDAAGAQRRADYITSLGKGAAFLVEYDFVLGRTLLRVSKGLTPEQADAYKNALIAAGIK